MTSIDKNIPGGTNTLDTAPKSGDKPKFLDNEVFSKGHERVEALKTTISGYKNKISNWFSKGKSFLGEALKTGMVVAGATPELARAGADKASAAIERGSDALQAKMEMAHNWAAVKAERAKAWVEDKKQTAEAIAELTKMLAIGAAAEVAAKAIAIKEDIANKWETMVEYGKDAVFVGETVIRQLKKSFFEKLNTIRAERLKSKLEANDAKRIKLEAKLATLNAIGKEPALATA
jgi:hypothetical protein